MMMMMMMMMTTTKDIKIEKLQRRAARIIMQTDSSNGELGHLKYDKPGLSREIHVLKLAKKSLNKRCLQFLMDYCYFNRDILQKRTRQSNHQSVCPSLNQNVIKKLYIIMGVQFLIVICSFLLIVFCNIFLYASFRVFFFISLERTSFQHFQNISGAPAAEGPHAKPHTCKTYAFISVWSSLSAVNGSRARTYVRAYDENVPQHGAHAG